jgi:hypothetical protein
MIVQIGKLGVRITIERNSSAESPSVIMKGMHDRLGRFAAGKGAAHFELTIQPVPNIPWRAIIDRDDFTSMRGVVRALEQRFPFTRISFEEREIYGIDRVASPPSDHIVLAPSPRLNRGDLSIIPQKQFLLLVDHATGRGHALIKGQDTDEYVISLMKALQGAVSLVAPDYGALMLHASSLAIDGWGYLFVGASGAGKSTIASTAGAQSVLSDDGSWCCRTDGGFSLFPTPFSQLDPDPKAGGSAPLKRILFLEKGTEDRIADLSPGRAMVMLLSNHIHFLRFMGRGPALTAFGLAGEICRRHPVSTLVFTRDFDPKPFFREIADESKKAV